MVKLEKARETLSRYAAHRPSEVGSSRSCSCHSRCSSSSGRQASHSRSSARRTRSDCGMRATARRSTASFLAAIAPCRRAPPTAPPSSLADWCPASRSHAACRRRQQPRAQAVYPP